MERANQALRRSSVKLKCLNSGHSDLHMIISDIKEIKSAFKSFHLAQLTTWEDLSKWANKEKTIALQEILHILLDLHYLWSEVQLDFIAGLKKFKHQFELILESETLLDKSKSHLNSCEQRESRVRKDLNKATAKGNIDEAKKLAERQVECQALVKVAQTEVKSKALENEAVKLMLVKEGLLNISSCYLGLTERASMIFQAHKEVTRYLPDVHDREIEDIRYPGADMARNIVIKTKESVHNYKKAVEAESAPPPPYSRSPVCQRHPSLPSYGLDVSQNLAGYSSDLGSIREYASGQRDLPVYSPSFSPTSGNIDGSGGGRPPNYPPLYDLPPTENQDAAEGAVGGTLDNSSRRYTNV